MEGSQRRQLLLAPCHRATRGLCPVAWLATWLILRFNFTSPPPPPCDFVPPCKMDISVIPPFWPRAEYLPGVASPPAVQDSPGGGKLEEDLCLEDHSQGVAIVSCRAWLVPGKIPKGWKARRDGVVFKTVGQNIMQSLPIRIWLDTS